MDSGTTNFDEYGNSPSALAELLAVCVTCITCPAAGTHCDMRASVRDCESIIERWLASPSDWCADE